MIAPFLDIDRDGRPEKNLQSRGRAVGELLGPGRMFRSVEEAIRAFRGKLGTDVSAPSRPRTTQQDRAITETTATRSDSLPHLPTVGDIRIMATNTDRGSPASRLSPTALYRQHLKGHQAGGHAGHVTDQVRAGDQPQYRQGARSRNSTKAPRARRRGACLSMAIPISSPRWRPV